MTAAAGQDRSHPLRHRSLLIEVLMGCPGGPPCICEPEWRRWHRAQPVGLVASDLHGAASRQLSEVHRSCCERRRKGSPWPYADQRTCAPPGPNHGGPGRRARRNLFGQPPRWPMRVV